MQIVVALESCGVDLFLATTALSEFWGKDREILCLDYGCLRPDRQGEWASLNYKVMTSPWTDRNRFYEAARYLDDYCERVLDQCTEYLNNVHQVSHGRKYWRILIGPWLLQHLHAVYDRYIHLSEAFSQHPGLQTTYLDSNNYRVPQDTADFSAQRRGDIYRLQLATEILSGMGYEFPTLSLPNLGEGAPIAAGTGRKGWSGTLGSARNSVLRLLEGGIVNTLSKVRPMALLQMDLPRTMTWGIALRTGLRAIPSGLRNQWPFPLPAPVFDERRNGISNLTSTSEFERLFVATLPNNFPTLYLEGFSSAKTEILGKLSSVPPMLMSDNGWYSHEPFKFLAAAASERGSRLVAGQHGGTYGTYKSMPFELHEARLSDSYMVWGWADKKTPPFRNLPSPKLSHLYANWTRNRSHRNDGPVLFMTAPYRPYMYRFHSAPVGSLWEDYIEWQFRFLESSPETLRNLILFRSRADAPGWSVRNRILQRFPDVHWDGPRPFDQSLKKCRLAVIDHPSTTILESLTANVPTVVFWHPERYEWRSEAAPYFEALQQSGVLHHSPEEAAAKAASVSDNPWEWWGGEEVQQARRQFAERYALARKDWSSQWATALKQELGSQELSNSVAHSAGGS